MGDRWRRGRPRRTSASTSIDLGNLPKAISAALPPIPTVEKAQLSDQARDWHPFLPWRCDDIAKENDVSYGSPCLRAIGRGSNPSNIAKTCTTSTVDDQKVALLDSLSGTAFSFNQAKALEILLCRQTDPLLAQAGEPCGSAFNYAANKLAKHGHPGIRRKAGPRCDTDKGPR